MISESQQEQAALYALTLLDADEAAAFERNSETDSELRALVRELQETAATLALAGDEADFLPSAELKKRVLAQFAAEADRPTDDAESKIVRPRFDWVPWAAAASLLACAGWLALDRSNLARQLVEARSTTPSVQTTADVLSKVAFCELEPTPDAPVKPRAAVLWDPAQHKGVLRIRQLAPPASGRDYQLWAVEAARKEPVNAGVVHVDADGHADVPFQPDAIPGDNKVVAMAISLEQAGGAPTNQGPILFLGKL